MRSGILGLTIMASVTVLVASLTTANARKSQGNSAQKTVSEEEVIDKLGSRMMLRSYHKPKPQRNFGKSIHIPECTKDQCTEQSVNMSRMMNKTADPCKDFYEYACGGWIAEGLPPDQAKWTIFALLAEQTENKLKSLIEGQKNSANSVGQLVYNWYASCTDQHERNRLGAAPLVDLIQRFMGPKFTPFADDWSDEDWKLEDVLAAVHRSLGVFPLFTVSLGIDPRNSSSPTRLSLSEVQPLLKSHEAYLSAEGHAKEMAEAYEVLMAKIVRLLKGHGWNPNLSDALIAVEEIKEILLFEVELVKAMKKQQNEELAYLLEGNAEGLQKILPEFDWRRYFNKLTEGLGEKSFSDSELIFVEYSQKYLKKLMEILKNNPKRIVANYITWTIIYKHAPYLSSEFHDAYMEFSHAAYGIQKSSPLWRRCVRGTDSSLDMGVSMLFIKEIGFTNESRGHADQMVHHIRHAFIDNLNNVTWMDAKTKQAAKEKAEAMFQQIGYPDFIMNQTKLEEYFQGLQADAKQFFQNKLRESALRMNNTLLLRGRPLNRYAWDMRPTEINAYYSPAANKIVVPAGILQPPFYYVDLPHAENFGALGFVVGHELTHGFDSNGAKYDKDGNLANWWSSTSLDNFKKREECLVRQYDQCLVQGHQLNGRLTLGENTADNGGLKLAYKAYRNWLRNKDHDSTLPNLGLTSDQLFFLSFAQIWCEKSTPSYALSDLEANPHSPGKWRVKMTLQNSADFARAFNCASGTPMNPEEKCEVW